MVSLPKGALSALVLAAASMSLATIPGIANASLALPTVVSPVPAAYTPHVQSDGTVSHPRVLVLEQNGTMMYAGGQFRSVENGARTTTYTRYNLMGFDASTGAMSTSFVPNFNGAVWAIEASGSSLYVGGTFTTVNGVARRGLAKIDAATGALDPSFKPPVNSGGVTEVRLVSGRLLVAGSYGKKIAALNPATGADTGYINISVTGSVASNGKPTEVYKFAVNPAGDRLVGIGNFTTVAGSTRYRAFMLDLGGTAALDPWYYTALEHTCLSTVAPDYIKGVDFSPDGSYFVFAAGGYVASASYPYNDGTTLCDAVSRFETNVTSPSAPTWINYSGGDSLYAVAATGTAVYVQGHQRWLDNADGKDDDGQIVSPQRPGIGALDPSTGKVLSWNPTKSRAEGGKTFLVTSAGLWVPSDGQFFDKKYHYGIAFCPLP